MNRTKLSAEFVRGLFEARDGVLFLRPRADSLFWCPAHAAAWNKRFAGRPARTRPTGKGYATVRYGKHALSVHRVLWVLHYGDWPTGELDHINGDIHDNRIENLRDVSKSENMRNQFVRKDSTSGFPGVHFCKHKSRRPWAARIGLNGTWKTLGYFETKEEAVACRQREQVKFGFTARHGTSPQQATSMTPAVILPPTATIRTGAHRYWFLPILQPEQVKLVVAMAEKGRG